MGTLSNIEANVNVLGGKFTTIGHETSDLSFYKKR